MTDDSFGAAYRDALQRRESPPPPPPPSGALHAGQAALIDEVEARLSRIEARFTLIAGCVDELRVALVRLKEALGRGG